MTGRSKAAQLAEVLDRLEARYGRLVQSDDPVEAGVLTLLALHAPKLSNADTRTRLREAFGDWNEMRVADPWDVSSAIEAGGDPDARNFAKAALRFLEGLNAVLYRTSFDGVKSDPAADLPALLDRLRAPAPVRAVVLAALDSAGGWHPGPEMAKTLAKLGFAGKSTSSAKVGRDAQDAADPADRLRAHFLLTRYGCREKDEDDPLEAPGAKKPQKAAAKASRPRKAAAKD